MRLLHVGALLLLTGCGTVEAVGEVRGRVVERWFDAGRSGALPRLGEANPGSRAEGTAAPRVAEANPASVERPVPGGGAGLGRALEFLRETKAEVEGPERSEREKRVGKRALACTWERVLGMGEGALAKADLRALYEGCWVEAGRAERAEAAEVAAREAKLDEYWRWAVRQWGEAPPKFQRAGKAWLVTEAPERGLLRDVLVRAVLDWGMAHRNEAVFLKRHPSEVALYLLAQRGVRANVSRVNALARGHLDYTPELDPNRVTTEALAAELALGFVPGVGEVVFAVEAVTGISVTGHQLEMEERILTGLCVLLPFAAVLRGGGGVERAALLTGRSLDEVRVLSRVASHLSAKDVEEIERILRGVSQGRHVSPEELERLNQMARGMEGPLLKLADAVRAGGKDAGTLLTRMGADGAPLAVGTPEHMAQCWLEYQFRYQERLREFSYAVDPRWEKLYRTILENASAGGEFEQSVLAAKGYRKNTALMMPPMESGARGFIPDAVKGNPSELVWGEPYEFVEVKGRQDLSLGGNLEAMLMYVKEYGGHVEVWVRSAKHPAGPTHVSRPLQRLLKELKESHRAGLKPFPE